MVGEMLHHGLTDAAGLHAVAIGQKGGKFLAADAGENGVRAQKLAGNAGEAAQHLIARGMAMAVIDRLEMVHIEGQQRERAMRLAQQTRALLEEPLRLPRPVR